MTADKRIAVAQVGLDPKGGGGMAAVERSLLESRLADRYRFEMIVTYRSASPAARLATFALALLRLAAWCLRPGPRIVHVHSAVRGSLYRKSICLLVVWLLRRPSILHLHAGRGDIEEFAARLDPFRRAAFAWLLRRADRILAVSSASARAMEECFGLSGIGVVPNAAPPLPAGAAPVEPGGGAERRVLYVGGFANPVKGGETLVEALGQVAPSRTDTAFVLAGPGQPPASLAALEARQPNVRWVGWLDGEAKGSELTRCDVFVLPSLSEGLPVALLEAMSWGRAIVASRAGGIPDVVADGVEAVLVPPGKAGPLGEAIGELLGDPERSQRLGRAAAARAASLNEDEVYGQLDALYRELLDG